MKLISEFTENDVEFLITEDKKTGKKNYAIQGIFAQAEKKNRNGRIYPMPIMEKALNKYDTEQVQKGRAVGELNHPEGCLLYTSPSPRDVSRSRMPSSA